MFFVYFLRSRKDGSFYVGQTNCMADRLARHNSGLVKSTKSRAPFDLVYREMHATRREAMLREKHLKSIAGVKEKKAILENLDQGL